MTININQRMRHIRPASTIIIREFRDIKLVKIMDKEHYYVLDRDGGYTWDASWTYIEANSEYENRIIERINETQEYIKEIKEMKLTSSNGKLILPCVSDFVDIVIPLLDIVISDINKSTFNVECGRLKLEEFENRELFYRGELKKVLECLANK
ncbi:MAG: hypothetical protein IJH55_05280 [Romboutsia sp.]|nr:hypothetical protein [Romboutsia sp.]